MGICMILSYEWGYDIVIMNEYMILPYDVVIWMSVWQCRRRFFLCCLQKKKTCALPRLVMTIWRMIVLLCRWATMNIYEYMKYVYAQIYVYVCMFLYLLCTIYTCIYVYIHTHTYMQMNAYIFWCIDRYIYKIYIYMYIYI